ncbi:MAG TPA: YetF domain-containing protein [Thermomicrobiales bacterium]|nr:YetF domain-containing protein [Thermomicrobiales bacterium]
MFFDNVGGLVRVIVVGLLAYTSLIVVLRVSGKRTLSKMNAFDLIVTVALGSTLASVITSNQVALAEGVLALTLLISLQYAVAWLSVRSEKVGHFVKSEPRLLFYRGEFLRDQMRRERVVEAEVRQAIRLQGSASTSEVEAVVLETDGSFSVMSATDQDPTALQGVQGR